MKDIVSKLQELIKKPWFLKVAVGVGLLIMLVIAFSDFSGDDKELGRASEINTDTTFISADLYAEQMQSKLKDILMTIEGVGKAEVLLTITSTEEYVYAESYKQSTSQAENSYVIIDKGSQKEALVKKINNPSISGVVIVCEGGDSSKICEKVYKAVSTALNIPTNRIYVTEMK